MSCVNCSFVSKERAEVETFKAIVQTNVTSFNFDNYHDLDTIYSFLNGLVYKYPSVVKLVQGGMTYENRKIIGALVSFSEKNKYNGVFLEGGIHANEWIGPATVLYILNEILTSKDKTIRKVVEIYDWYVFPVFNPDGYEYSRKHDRLWRKSRKPYDNCVGADLNRNWDFHWNEIGTNSSSCGEFYPGSEPFSEIETKTLANYISSIGFQLDAYLAFHSYAQALLFPYAYTKKHLVCYNELLKVGEATVCKLESYYGNIYEVGSASEKHMAGGVSMDWVKSNFETRIIYTYELPSLKHGFFLPTNKIIPTGIETFGSLITMLQEAKKLN